MSVLPFRNEADRRILRARTPDRVETAVELIPESTLLRNIAELLNLPPKPHPTTRGTFQTTKRVKTSRNGTASPHKLNSPATTSRRMQRRSEGNIVPPLSPIDALASVAAQQTSPIFTSPRQPYFQAQVSPSTTAWPPFQWDASRQPPHLSSYQDERPAKRARSELLPSPQQPSPHFPPSASRPATSHNMPHGWGYNVEQSINNRQRLHSVASTWQHHNRGTVSRVDDANRMSDAELLLDFARSVNAMSNSHRRLSTEVKPVTQSPIATNPTLPYSPLTGAVEQGSLASPAQFSDHNFGPPLSIPNGHCTETRRMSAQHHHGLGVSLALQTETPPDEPPRMLPTQSSLRIEPNPTEIKENEGQILDSQKAHLDTKIAVATVSTPAQVKLQDIQEVNVRGETTTTIPNSPQSLTAEPNEPPHASISSHIWPQTDLQHQPQTNDKLASSPKRPNSASNIPIMGVHPEQQDGTRARSVPLQNQINTEVSALQGVSNSTPLAHPNPIDEGTKCAGCDISPNSFSGEFVDWLQCNGCKQWFHLACAGFTTREVRKIDKFYCLACLPKYGKTTFVRKSSRAHTSIDYAGLNEGVWRTSDETVEHHYIKPIKEGNIKVLPENFPRMTPEEVTAEYFEKCSNMGEPIVIPGYLNPRSTIPTKSENHSSSEGGDDDIDSILITEEAEYSPYEQKMVTNNGHDRLDMVIPQGLTVRQVAELYGAEMPIEVIDVKSQEGDSSKKWTVGKWADYYEATGEKVIRNVISLEVSKSLLGRLIRRPKVVRDLDLQDAVWPSSDERRTSVGFYCLMSVADSYTDFHIDFAGSSVYYHILKGKKTFFFIPPTNKNLKKYEEWCLNKAMNSIWLPDLTKECYRIDLSPGDTMLIPSGWIHSVWTPEDSLVIGGNFLTRLHYSMQLRVVEIERNCRVPLKYRYPFFQKVMWYTIIKYLEQDPLPESVRMRFYSGNKFERKTPVYLETSKFGQNSDVGEENYHARYYSKQELNGLPDLVNYIFRTLMIYLDRLEGITQESRKAVTRSIPKGKGDPLELARAFAIWVAWKRGNEDIPLWSHPNGPLANRENSLSANNDDDTLENKPETVKKISLAEMKKLERAMPVKGYQPPPQYPPTMQALFVPDSSADEDVQMTDPSLANTPKTSVLGPKRTACDTCRKRKMRCKHIPDSPPGARTAIGVVIDRQPNTKVRTMLAPGPNGAGVMVAGVMLSPEHIGRQRDPTVVVDQIVGVDGKKGRNKACAECRRSKRRCVHDENGNIDPVKQNEPVVPRGSGSKKHKSSGGDDSDGSVKKIKLDPGDDAGLFLSDDSTPNGIQKSPFSAPAAQMTTAEGLDYINLNPSLAIAEQDEFVVPASEHNDGTFQDAGRVEPLNVDSDLLTHETHPSASDDLNGLPKSQGLKPAQQRVQALHKLTNGSDQQITFIEAFDENSPRDIIMTDITSLVDTTSTHNEPVPTSSPQTLPNGTSIGSLIDTSDEPKHSDTSTPASDDKIDAAGPELGSVSTTAPTEQVAEDVENGVKSGDQHQQQEPPTPPIPTTEKQRRHSSRQSRPVDRFSPIKPPAASPTPGGAVRRKENSTGILSGKSTSPDTSAAGISKVKQNSPVNQKKSLSVKHVTATAATSTAATKGKEVKSNVIEETEEEASLRLAIEMQAQEFSLRRRSR